MYSLKDLGERGVVFIDTSVIPPKVRDGSYLETLANMSGQSREQLQRWFLEGLDTDAVLVSPKVLEEHASSVSGLNTRLETAGRLHSRNTRKKATNGYLLAKRYVESNVERMQKCLYFSEQLGEMLSNLVSSIAEHAKVSQYNTLLMPGFTDEQVVGDAFAWNLREPGNNTAICSDDTRLLSLGATLHRFLISNLPADFSKIVAVSPIRFYRPYKNGFRQCHPRDFDMRNFSYDLKEIVEELQTDVRVPLSFWDSISAA